MCGGSFCKKDDFVYPPRRATNAFSQGSGSKAMFLYDLFLFSPLQFVQL